MNVLGYLKGRIRVADGVKVANQFSLRLTLRRGGFLNYLGGGDVIAKILRNAGGRQKGGELRGGRLRQTPWLGRWREGPGAEGGGVL